MEREKDLEIECVQNDRNVFISRDRERVCREIERVCVCERVTRDIKGQIPTVLE